MKMHKCQFKIYIDGQLAKQLTKRMRNWPLIINLTGQFSIQSQTCKHKKLYYASTRGK